MAHLAISFWYFVSHDLLHPLEGPGSARQGGYLFWSGIAGSFLLGGGMWVGALTMYRKHNCHARWCWRIGRHPAAGGKYVVCTKHHPHTPRRLPSVQRIHDEHHEWLRRVGHVHGLNEPEPIEIRRNPMQEERSP